MNRDHVLSLVLPELVDADLGLAGPAIEFVLAVLFAVDGVVPELVLVAVFLVDHGGDVAEARAQDRECLTTIHWF